MILCVLSIWVDLFGGGGLELINNWWLSHTGWATCIHVPNVRMHVCVCVYVLSSAMVSLCLIQEMVGDKDSNKKSHFSTKCTLNKGDMYVLL